MKGKEKRRINVWKESEGEGANEDKGGGEGGEAGGEKSDR